MRRFDAVIFDMDGLLINSEAMGLGTFVETCQVFKIPVMARIYSRVLGLKSDNGEQYLRGELKKFIDPDHFLKHWSMLYCVAQDNHTLELMPGATLLLQGLSSENIPIAIATSSNRVTATERLTTVGIYELFSHVVSGDDVERGKPFPDIFLEAAKRLNVSANKCVALEDSDNGVQAAVSAGMTVFQVPGIAAPEHEFDCNTVQLFQSLEQVVPVLCGLMD